MCLEPDPLLPCCCHNLQGELDVIIFTAVVICLGAVLHPLLQVRTARALPPAALCPYALPEAQRLCCVVANVFVSGMQSLQHLAGCPALRLAWFPRHNATRVQGECCVASCMGLTAAA